MLEEKIQSAIGKILDGIRATGAQCELVASTPKPVVLIAWTGEWSAKNFPTSLKFVSHALGELLFNKKTCSLVRCVGIDRLSIILQHGCDVQPTDSVLWTDRFPSKALEYGGEEKVMMVFDAKRTEPTFQEMRSDSDKHALEELRAVYPTVVAIDDSRLWFSRLPAGSSRVHTPYEIEHGRWIPGDPIEALAGLLVLGRNLEEMKVSVRSSIAACQHPSWK